jgi:hypothetical protein
MTLLSSTKLLEFLSSCYVHGPTCRLKQNIKAREFMDSRRITSIYYLSAMHAANINKLLGTKVPEK